MKQPRDKFSRWVFTSMVLHVGLAVMVVVSPSLFPTRGDTMWGSETGDGAINVRITSGGFSGIPLPAPPTVRENAAANESPGLYQPPAAPPVSPPPAAAAAPPDAIPIPAPNAPRRPTQPVPEAPTPAAAARQPPSAQPSRQPARPEADQPDNAVPYGEGGRPNVQYGQFSTGAGTGGISFGDGAFGSRYGPYVQAMTRQISAQWLRGLVNSSVRSAPRVYVGFTIARDGSVSNVRIEQRSGIASLDRSAERAILAASPLPPLPSDFRGSSVSVSFYFEYVR